MFLRAFVVSLFYGPLVALMTVPVGLLVGVTLLVAGGVLLLPLVGLILSCVLPVAIWVQAARYAGRVTGLCRFTDMPPFMQAFWKVLPLTIILQVVLGVLMAVAAFSFGDAGKQVMADSQQLFGLSAGGSEFRAAAPDPEEHASRMVLVTVIFVLSTMLFISILAMFVIPRCCGLGLADAGSYTPGLLLGRFLIVMPAYALIAALFYYPVNRLLEMAPETALLSASMLMLNVGFMSYIYTGMILSFEAVLVREGRRHGLDEQAARDDAERVDPSEYRALREQWSARDRPPQ